ncbi:rhodanese-like domain-containing protein [Amycolatopsis cihanbeyliensis]|nr:rhodanese-like domain-containing protein [Amycolatopsis cihanbeyliensis]
MTPQPRVLTHPAGTAGAAAEFFAAELAFEADPDDLARDLADGDQHGYVVVEARSREAFAQARIPGAINLPYRELTAESTAHLDRSKVYVCYCESFQCNAATKGALRLAELGFLVKRLAGGITAWRAAGYPLDGDPSASSGPATPCTC